MQEYENKARVLRRNTRVRRQRRESEWRERIFGGGETVRERFMENGRTNFFGKQLSEVLEKGQLYFCVLLLLLGGAGFLKIGGRGGVEGELDGRK